jgi:hypothetical protein
VTDPADAILITAGDGNVIALGQPVSRPMLRIYGLDFEFANAENVSVASMFPWKAEVPAEVLRDGPLALDFWALDVSSKTIARIQETLNLDKAAKKAEIVAE